MLPDFYGCMRGIFGFTPRHLADSRTRQKGNISFRQLREVSVETPGELARVRSMRKCLLRHSESNAERFNRLRIPWDKVRVRYIAYAID